MAAQSEASTRGSCRRIGRNGLGFGCRIGWRLAEGAFRVILSAGFSVVGSHFYGFSVLAVKPGLINGLSPNRP